MPVNINENQQGLFFVLEAVATSGTYAAPTVAAFLQTIDLKPAFNKSDKKTLNLDGLGRPVKKTFMAKKHHQLPFGVAVSWPAAAPTATTNLLAVDPVLQVCGASAPVLVAATTVAPIVPAHVKYTELDDINAVRSGSASHRRTRSSAKHYERQVAGCRGIVKFKWKTSEVPKFEFDLFGKWKERQAVAPLVGTPGIQLTNIAQPSNALNTVNVLLNGKALCAVEIDDDNVWRMKASVIESLCGVGAQAELVEDSKLMVTVRHVDIETEFNPDLYWGNDYPFEYTIKGDGALNVRSLCFSWALVNVDDVEDVVVDGLLHHKLTLKKLSPLVLQQF